jgi:hypothetical protein
MGFLCRDCEEKQAVIASARAATLYRLIALAQRPQLEQRPPRDALRIIK